MEVRKPRPEPAVVRQMTVYLGLEPYEGKLSRTVLRRERRSNPPDPAATKDGERAARIMRNNISGVEAGLKQYLFRLSKRNKK